MFIFDISRTPSLVWNRDYILGVSKDTGNPSEEWATKKPLKIRAVSRVCWLFEIDEQIYPANDAGCSVVLNYIINYKVFLGECQIFVTLSEFRYGDNRI